MLLRDEIDDGDDVDSVGASHALDKSRDRSA
jgi:hypothetical protein